jgi:hypothetical protein
MKTTVQIAKQIDLKRILSIIEDEPLIQIIQPYNFDLPIVRKFNKKI